MDNDLTSPDEEADEYYMLPEDAFKLLPNEWREHFQAVADDGRAILKSVDSELSQLSRLSRSFVTLAALKHVRDRLADYKFAADMDTILELDMLTTAFVVTYVRLQQGGHGSGFSRDALPLELREAHDQIIELRNKRFAHNAEHDSVSNALEIELKGGRFSVNLNFSLGFHVGGANEWHELVDFLDHLFAERQDKLMIKLNEKTGYEWGVMAASNAHAME